MAPIVKYDTVRFNLTPMVEGPFVGYGPKVDEAWDSIANDSKWNEPFGWNHMLSLFEQWATK